MLPNNERGRGGGGGGGGGGGSSSQPAPITLCKVLQRWNTLIDKEGLDTVLSANTEGDLNGVHARPRLIEIAGAMNRLRREGTFFQN